MVPFASRFVFVFVLASNGLKKKQMLAKAKAKAAPPKPGDKWKRAMSRIGKTLKEVIGSDLHPGYTEEVNQPTKPDAKTDGSSSKSL